MNMKLLVAFAFVAVSCKSVLAEDTVSAKESFSFHKEMGIGVLDDLIFPNGKFFQLKEN